MESDPTSSLWAFASQNGPATVAGAAGAGVATLGGGRMALVEDVGVVVRQLFARLDVANRLDPDTAVVDHRVAVRVARVVDEPCLVAADGGVDYHVVVDREKERVVPFSLDVGIARVGLGRSETLAGVFDETYTRRDAAGGECAQALNRRPANLERITVVRQGTFNAFCSTWVTPPEMMNAITSAASASMRRTWLDGTTRMWPAKPYDCGM